VTVDPDHSFGRPRFARGGAAVDDVIDLFQAGEPVDAVAEEFGLSRNEVEDAIRVATQHPPRFFLDRSLGRRAVPEALRADGWDLITLAEHLRHASRRAYLVWVGSGTSGDAMHLEVARG
jgi:uncharacterized protein (DUF433 family)